ncbi:MAG: TolC family outer membrane protein [Pseudomonadales bacterium]
MKYFRISSACGALVLLLASTTANATNLLDVYTASYDNDPVLGAARAGYQASRQAVPQARSALLPSLNAGASTTYTEREFPGGVVTDPSSIFFGQSLPDQEFNDHGWNAQLSQPVLDMNAWFTLGSAKASVRAAESNLDATEQELIVRVVRAYLNVLRAQDLLDTTTAEETAVKRQLEQVQQRFDVGLVAITDVLESQAAYDNAVVRRIQADGDRDIFFETLGTLSGEYYETLDRLSVKLPIVNPNPQDEREWVAAAMAQNLGIRTAQEQLAAARRTVQARRSGHYPTIDATVTQVHSVTGAPNFFGADTTDQTVYGLQFNMPLYNGGLIRSRTKEATALAEQARELLLNQQRTVTRDTRNLFQSVATDVVRVRARLKAIKSSQSALDATETGYEVGTRNIVDVLQAQQRLFSSQFDYADSRYNYVTNLMLLKQVAGVLVKADLEELNSYTDPNDKVERIVLLSNSAVNTGAN